jgi:hypothetical protein
MENIKETLTTTVDNDQSARSEYCFVYNRALLKKELNSPVGTFFWMSVIIVSPYFFFPDRAFWHIFLLPFFTFILFSLRLIHCLRLRITINQEGITCKGFLFREIPRFCSWSELSEVEIPPDGRGGYERGRLDFMYRSIKPYSLYIGNSKKPGYIGVGHSLSLEDVLERYVGPIKGLSDAKKYHGAFGVDHD